MGKPSAACGGRRRQPSARSICTVPLHIRTPASACRAPRSAPPTQHTRPECPGSRGPWALSPEPCAGTSVSLMSWGQGCSKPGIQPEHGPDGSERALLSRQPPREVAEPTGHSAVGSGEDLWIKDRM